MLNQTQYLKRYGVAILSVMIALLLMLALDPVAQLTNARFLLFFSAVTISAFYGGRSPGIVATLLSAGFAYYYFLEPQYSWNLNQASGLQLALFILEGVLTSLLVGALRATQAQLRKNFHQLEAIQAENQNLTQALQRRVDELQTLFDVIPVNIALAEDPECHVVKVNTAYATLLQIPTDTNVAVTPRAKQSQLPYKFYQNGRKLQGHELPVEYAAKHGVEVRDVEIELVRQDNTVFSLYGNAVPLFDESGQPRGSIGVYTNITERKRAEEALRESEERFRVLADCAPCLIWLNGVEGGCEFVNQAYLNFFGKTLEEVQGNGWQPSLHPDDARQYISAYLEALQERKPFQAQVRAMRADGEYRWLDSYGMPRFSHSGDLLGYVGTSFDITENKQAEEALQRSEAAFRTISNAAPALVWVGSPDGTIIFFNDRWYEFTGQTEAEAVGFGWVEIIHPDDAERILPHWEHCRQTGETYEGEVRYRRHDGEYCWHAFRAFPHRSTDGEIESWYGLSIDISDRKRSETTLRESERRFRRLVESNMFGVAFGDFTGGIHYVNEYFLKMMGYTRKEIEAGQVQWIDITPPEFLPLDEQAMVELRTNGVATPFEKEYIRKDGTRVPILIGAALLDEPYDQQQEIIAFYVDLTERKQTENALRQALQKLNFHVENTPMAVIEWDQEFRLTRWSGAAERLFGWQADEVLGTLLTDLQFVFEEDIEQVAEVLRRLMVGEEFYVFSYNRNYTKRGDVIHCEWYNSSLRDESGRMLSVLSLVLDVTARVQAERDRERILQQEQAAREAAEAANRIKDEFLAVVSHELRSPLNPILGWSKLLRSHQLDQQKTERALEVIERNAQIQAQLINDLLDVSRILRGKFSLDSEPVDLVFTIQAAMETVRLAVEAKSIQIHTQFEPDIGYVAGDAGRLQQVVWNLLTNAVKFTSQGGRVDIQLERVDAQAQIIVRDTGIGIPPDFLPYVFDQFRQESSATTRRFGGLGLGLAIVRYLVELHGGTVQADSLGAGQGATFTVRLPLMLHQQATKQDTKPSESSLNLQGTRILVVDDDDNTREFLAFLLELHGANVIATATATEAITTLTQFKPDVLLSDIGMPDVDGYMLMRQVRALSPQQGGTIPAIALTAYAGEINYQQAMAAGFQRHIPKPIEPQVLIQAIAELRA
ncbi:MAG: PAS domain S-box protein [Mojavia pulchra JT2-VF2]|uniref:Circadian input-output histidine kinase CikA n=1 Tax=Mojavia pulchra JT2-VF2 TaxID=287848 RepID=A0A951Q4K1_9NOST|nr:PAS domain S-box protein [Mojavia pulchra JT2-VF2]